MMEDELTNEWGEPYQNHPCEFCCSETNGDGECEECEPRVGLEYSPVRASFLIVDGVVSEVVS